MTERQEEERPYEEPENPVEELIQGFEKTKWRPARSPWGEAQRQVRETEKRHEELMKAWRSRRVGPAPEDTGNPPA
ncbi:hypothetical protein GBA65_05060 [Rubrobacter marinus]|uniref:Uncharacterized protein n=1 Tax=Rubrobacter marinus TaxID=2653852 RepID=A0A6G8PUW0_9ACTN|nr:hypothetical protein [Rubrobacter marinus]QIN77991.1 hypothetical protein GBA65_05060 [Rubrobacter marinus]